MIWYILKVAADADDKSFIATPCSVQAMENIWYDKMLPDNTKSSPLSVILSILTFGLLAPAIITYRQCQLVRINF